MASLYGTRSLIKLLLFISGIALILMGIYGALIDFIHDWKVDEIGSIFAVLSGAAILLGTYLIYVVIPEYQNRQRIELLKRYYEGQPHGEARDIKHNILERSQGIVGSVDILTASIEDCIKEDLPYGVCIEKISLAQDVLAHIDRESNKLKIYLKQLEDHVKTKQQSMTK